MKISSFYILKTSSIRTRFIIMLILFYHYYCPLYNCYNLPFLSSSSSTSSSSIKQGEITSSSNRTTTASNHYKQHYNNNNNNNSNVGRYYDGRSMINNKSMMISPSSSSSTTIIIQKTIPSTNNNNSNNSNGAILSPRLSPLSSRSSSDESISKTTVPIPSKWEPIWNEFFHKPKTISSTRFFLYTRNNPSQAQELCIDDFDSLKQSNFQSNKRIVFLINGWQDNRFFAKWVRLGIRNLLERDDQNIIYVSWRSLKELFFAAMVIRSYSDYLSKFINFLKSKYYINGEQIHCIGHSLGGFMCGFAGSKTYIGRVTVLDAGPRPYFQSRPPWERLNRYQAGFMDVIHSDFNPTFSLGLTIPYGDLDFFPNGGTIQPGCWHDKWYKPYKELVDNEDGEGLLTSLFQIPRYLFFCSHYRSHEWFFESIHNDKCQFIGVLCPNYEMFLDGQCGCEDIREWNAGHSQSTCAIMGYDSEFALLQQHLTKYSPQGRWFLKTSDFLEQTEKHCQYQYQLIIQLGKFLPPFIRGTGSRTGFGPRKNLNFHSNLTITIVANQPSNNNKYNVNDQIVLAEETLLPRSSGGTTAAGSSYFKSSEQLTKLLIVQDAIPRHIQSIFVRLETSSSSSSSKTAKKLSSTSYSITILWIKLAPIHVINNEPLFFCNLNHYLRPGLTKIMERCDRI